MSYPVLSLCPSTAGLMDNVLPRYRTATAQIAQQYPPPTRPRTGTIKGRANEPGGRQKGKGKETVLGKTPVSRGTKEKALRWAGRTIYSPHAPMCHAVEPNHRQRSERTQAGVRVQGTRLSDGNDFLPVMQDRYRGGSGVGYELMSESFLGTRPWLRSGTSTPDLCWLSESSSEESFDAETQEHVPMVLGSRRWLQDNNENNWPAGRGPNGPGKEELENIAEDMFSRFINVDECGGVC